MNLYFNCYLGLKITTFVESTRKKVQNVKRHVILKKSATRFNEQQLGKEENGYN